MFVRTNKLYSCTRLPVICRFIYVMNLASIFLELYRCFSAALHTHYFLTTFVLFWQIFKLIIKVRLTS